MSDALSAMFEDAAYAELLEDAAKDDRVGPQTFMVTERIPGFWDAQYGGGPRLELKGVLVSASNSKVSLTISPPPTPAEAREIKETGDRAAKQRAVKALSIARQLAEHYQVLADNIQIGDSFRVNINKTKIDPVTGKGGYLNIVAFLPKDAATNGSAPSSSGPGF